MSTTENLSTLKIHKLTKEQYEREKAASRLDATAIYLTPDEESGSGELPGYLKYGEKLAQFEEITIQGNTALDTQDYYIKLYSGYISPTAIESISFYTGTTLNYTITPSEDDISIGNGWYVGSIGFWAMGGGTDLTANVVFPSAGLWIYSESINANSKVVITPKVATVMLAPEFLPASISNVTNKFIVSGSNFRVQASLLPYGNASTTYQLGNSSYRWNKLFLPKSTTSGIDVGGTLINGSNLVCLTGLNQNVQNALTDLQQAVDAGIGGGNDAITEAEIAEFDSYYEAPDDTKYQNLPRQIAFGRRGMDSTTYNPYIYRPDIAYTINKTNTSSSKLYVKDDTMIYDSLDLAFSQGYCHYLHDTTDNTWYKLVGAGGTTVANTTVAGGTTTDLQVKVNYNGYFDVVNYANWSYNSTHNYKLYVMDWFPLLEPAENIAF